MTDARRDQERLALLYLDLDGFKSVNDTYGHAAGDRLLRMVAHRLRNLLRTGDLAARIGGDEFVVLMHGVDHSMAIEMGQWMIEAVSVSYDFDDGGSATVGASIGIALAPEHGRDLETLLAAADAALYEAKSRGKSRCSMASPMANVARLREMHAEATAARRPGVVRPLRASPR